MLRGVLEQCTAAHRADSKIAEFRRIYEEVVVRGESKLLVFSEYRATQDRLLDEVRRLSGCDPPRINGGQKLADKLAAIAAFDADAAVLVSTEAGGEGLNLQRDCHVPLNCDLPSNPARIVQRIGRVYRYGQTEHVVVLNLLSRDTIDAEIVSTALTRVNDLSREMASVSAEYDGRYASEVLGELLDQLDLSELFGEAAAGRVLRTDQRVADAVDRPRHARELQDEMLSGAGGFDLAALTRLGRFSTADVLRYLLRMAVYAGYTVAVGDLRRERFTLRLSEALRGRFAEFGGRTVIEATTSRQAAAAAPGLTLIDFRAAFLRHLIAVSSSPEFGGGFARLTLPGRGGRIAAFLARRQTDQGEPLGEELHVVRRAPGGGAAADEGVVAQLLRAPVATAVPTLHDAPTERHAALAKLIAAVEADAAAGVTHQRMLNDLVLLAVADPA